MTPPVFGDALRALTRTAEDIPGLRLLLFHTRIVGGGTNIDLGRQYDVARDGRFLINVAADEATGSPITVILNWAPASTR